MKKYISIYFIFISFSLFSCGPEKDKINRGLSDIKDTKILQYAIEGKILYENYCGNCHQNDGTGLGKLIPPLKGSDYMKVDIGRTVSIIKNGLKGEIIVNGEIYNQPMPANSQLTDMEIAKITTYIYNIWGNEEGIIDANQVGRYLKK
ncbi:cytochrome c, mono- and diheme variants family [Belliella baltica DSM 15883]|uniref:Cytochrome c, mono-and diheme variants family n=1 Tax=Belliella baltica (strain DSM 15883 / CIP 108006 / LMG 21964 / BA134) TaxID=866536 RepID=I3Z0B0_BELBD|nr:cytochrome c [Belliella baltica]AFL82678.1 cytochrome c, mono- and diheme variants family [Belliella baltica DSM 15883]